MIAGDLPDIPEFMDVSTLKVHAPSPVVIVCGGATDLDFNIPVKSLRDAFMRVSHKAKLSKFDIRLAEDLVKLPRSGYSNLLQLESDISQISELVLLFSESAGSLVELGLFVIDQEILPKLLVVVDRFNYKEDSFIRRGVLDYIESVIGDRAVCVIDLVDHGAERIEHVSGINLDTFLYFIEEKIVGRLSKKSEPTTFNPDRPGHMIKLITGLIQNYASLTLDEIDMLLYCINQRASNDDVRRFLGCAELFGWVAIERRGNRTFYSSKTTGRIAINYESKVGFEKFSKKQWRSLVRQYWKEFDADRFKAISAAAPLEMVL